MHNFLNISEESRFAQFRWNHDRNWCKVIKYQSFNECELLQTMNRAFVSKGTDILILIIPKLNNMKRMIGLKT